MRMDIKPLQTFLAAARVLGFGETARLLNYSQSTVSEHIRILESELGVQLFERIGRKVHLTDAGRQLIPLAEKINMDLSAVKAFFHPNEEYTGTLTIGSAESLCVFWLPPILKEYRRRYPKVQLVIRISDCPALSAWVRKNMVDAAFGMSDESGQPDLRQHVLFQGEACFVVAPDYELSRAKSVDIPILAAHPLIAPESSSSYRLEMDSMLRRAGVRPLSLMEFDSMEAIRQCVKHGLGVGLMPDLAIEEDLLRGSLVRLAWQGEPILYEAYMLLHREKWLAPPLVALEELIREEISGGQFRKTAVF